MLLLGATIAHAAEAPKLEGAAFGAVVTETGMVLPQAPEVAPGRAEAPADDPLAVARVRWNQGDAAGVVQALSPWLENRRPPWGRSRTAGHLLLGLAHMELQNWNLASAHFYRVRRSDSPLAPYGAWNEALVDHYRGRHTVAVKECTTYRETWPRGPQADECLLLIGDAWAAHGSRTRAQASYKSYLERNPDTAREEEIRLAIALAEAQARPANAVQMLQELAISHTFPSTAMAAEEALAQLAEDGHDTAIPDDVQTRMRRCESLRRSGRYDEAWASFQELAALAETDETVATWVSRNEDRFAWGTRRYDVLADSLAAEYAEAPSADLAWRIFSALRRAGLYDRVLEWGHKGLDEHGSTYRWRIAKDDVAWAALHAGAYPEAAERFGALMTRGGKEGRKYRFYHAYSLYQAGDHDAAIEAFDVLIKRRRDFEVQARYWRSKALAAQGKTDEAAVALEETIERDETGWYRLIRDAADVEVDPGWAVRDGLWHGGILPQAPSWSTTPPAPGTSEDRVASKQVVLVEGGKSRPLYVGRQRQVDWGGLSWASLSASTPTAVEPTTAALPEPSRDAAPDLTSVEPAFADIDLGTVVDTIPRLEGAFPSGYQACEWFDPAQSEEDFYRFSERYKALWSNLPAAYDLANAGLYTEAGIALAKVYREWDVARDASSPTERQQKLREVSIPSAEWRAYFLFVRDDYHAARFCYGLWKTAGDAEGQDEALRLAYPVVRAREVWAHGRTYGVDPYLMLGIMRQESRYRADALSHAGAIGLVQVMPRTGARVAAMLGESRYSPGDLQDPSINLRYGTYYLSRLLERFDGVFPLAVASYNGGPHNMSRWYRAYWERGIDLDAMVEQIEYDETRDYVKKVSGYYARYVQLYEPEGTHVVVPTRPRGDDAEVIDF